MEGKGGAVTVVARSTTDEGRAVACSAWGENRHGVQYPVLIGWQGTCSSQGRDLLLRALDVVLGTLPVPKHSWTNTYIYLDNTCPQAGVAAVRLVTTLVSALPAMGPEVRSRDFGWWSFELRLSM